MTKTIILHCGAQKTGSTSFQHLLYANRKMLIAAGFFLPATARKRAKGFDLRVGLAQLWTVKGTAKEDQIRKIRSGIDKILGKPGIHTLILSNESLLGRPFNLPSSVFYPRAVAQIADIAKALEGYDVKVVYYVRDLGGFIPSWYVQNVRMGATISFEHLLSKLRLPELSWLPMVRALRQHFGVERVDIHDQREFARSPHASLSAAFPTVMAALGEKGRAIPRKNPSVGEGMVKIYLGWNRLVRKLFGKGRMADRIRHVGRRYVLLPLEKLSRSRRLAMPEDLAKALKARYAEDWAAIKAERAEKPADASRTS